MFFLRICVHLCPHFHTYHTGLVPVLKDDVLNHHKSRTNQMYPFWFCLPCLIDATLQNKNLNLEFGTHTCCRHICICISVNFAVPVFQICPFQCKYLKDKLKRGRLRVQKWKNSRHEWDNYTAMSNSYPVIPDIPVLCPYASCTDAKQWGKEKQKDKIIRVGQKVPGGRKTL